jgi:hypothetical protein
MLSKIKDSRIGIVTSGDRARKTETPAPKSAIVDAYLEGIINANAENHPRKLHREMDKITGKQMIKRLKTFSKEHMNWGLWCWKNRSLR